MMDGRSLHDALLTVLADGDARACLLRGAPPQDGHAGIAAEHWAVLARLSQTRLIGVSRFLGRQYYRERIIRLFRYVRLLAPLTGRDPCAVLHNDSVLPFLDSAVLGSPQSAERLLGLVERYLTDADGEIRLALPFWRDLIRYQAALFSIEAERNTPVSDGRLSPYLRQSPCSRILDLEWDLPGLFVQLRVGPALPTIEGLMPKRRPTTLLVARGQHGRIATARCESTVRRMLEAADGRRDLQELARLAGIPIDHAQRLAGHLQGIGALM